MINYSNNGNFVQHSMASVANQQNINYPVQAPPASKTPPSSSTTTTTCELSTNFNNSVYLTDNKPFLRNKSDFVNNNSINSINDTFLMQKDTENVKRFSVNNLLQLANYSAGERNNLGKQEVACKNHILEFY